MSFDGRIAGLDSRKRALIEKRRTLLNWLLTPSHERRDNAARMVRAETWAEVRDIERQLDALAAIA
ncbi:MAG: hypothetical protein IJG15_05220 [Lachnospiraceae bacterium]|nr:hypothetical protein [Lachnospiraceae bacterium]